MPRRATRSFSLDLHLDRWLDDHAVALVSVVVGLGFCLRLTIALATAMPPAELYQLSTSGAPLWRLLGVPARMTNSDLLARTPSIVAGTVSIWIGYRYLRALAGTLPAMLGLLLLALLPASVRIGAQAGPHALLVLEILTALWAIHLTSTRDSLSASLVACFLMLLLALTDRSGSFVLLGFIPLTLATGVRSPQSRNRSITLVGLAIALAAGIVTWLSTVNTASVTAPTHRFGSHQGLLVLMANQLIGAFRSLLSAWPGAVVGLAALLASTVGLFAKTSGGTTDDYRRGGLATSALVPLMAALGASTAGLYQLGFGNQAAFLLPLVVFVIAAGTGTARVGLRRCLLATTPVVLVLLWVFELGLASSFMSYRHVFVQRAAQKIKHLMPGDGTLFCSRPNREFVARYLCSSATSGSVETINGTSYQVLGDYTVVSPATETSLKTDSLAAELRDVEDALGLGRGQPVCVVDCDGELRRHLADLDVELHRFGPTVTVLESKATGDALTALTAIAVRQLDEEIRTLLWPTEYMADSVRTLTRPLKADVLTYRQLYEMVRRNGERVFCSRLPALAFWLYGDLSESHWPLMRTMDKRKDRFSESYRFRLYATEPTGTAGMYVITAPASTALLALADRLRRHATKPFRTALLPGRYLSDTARRALATIADNVMEYRQLYLRIRTGRGGSLADFLPAVAFWEFGDVKPHPRFMQHLDDGVSFSTEEFSAHLLAADPESLMAAYAIEAATGASQSP